MGFLTSLFGGAGNSVVTIGLALAIVLILIILGVWALKLLFNATGNVRRGRNKRLMIIDTAVVDQKRQLVLIRRDNVEHLIMTGGGQDLLVESGIEPPEEQLQPARVKPRPAMPKIKRASRTQKPARRDEQPAPLPEVIAEEPTAPIVKPRQPVAAPAVDTGDQFTTDPTPQPDAPETETRSKSGQNALEKLSKLTRSKSEHRSTSLRHTGLLRSVSRTEPSINPQPSDTIAQISDADDADSAKTHSQSARRNQGTVDSENDEGNSGAESGSTNGAQDKTGTSS